MFSIGVGQAVNRRRDIIALLVVKDDVLPTAEIIHQSFSGTAVVTIIIGDSGSVGALLEEYTFNLVFLQMSSSPTATELEAVKTIRFNKTKNRNLLFSSIIPENFQDCVSGHRADIILCEPLTSEKLKIVVDCWKATFSSPDENGNLIIGGPSEVPHPLNALEGSICNCTDTIIHESSGSLRAMASSWSTSTACNSENMIALHSSKEKMRRERIRKCYDQLRLLLSCIHGTKTDVASILEATVEYMRCIQGKIPPAVTTQIVKTLQSNKQFCKRQRVHMDLSPRNCAVAQRKSSLVKSLSPWKRTRLWTDKYMNKQPSSPDDDCL
ncbi:spermatogenesis- and oogenesis-specific basic helix-loop-helix-containing protein 2 [Microcaecilia unicolor]|uniref:Spermatogenesis- and oogenesis-specific basic helix-loop-helix-containing protein 2 n=1 Tax=Microcaecilia unicolor TaxID=1415580 RepID=A0A6P7XXR6_9AMPH|nr:spermatogenesis- and oogenesis-specific basic helix-loop-helix-containing protein 2 [Microcaecilia unicolor]